MSLTVSRRSVFRSAAMVGALTLAAATIAPALGADPVLPPPSSVGTDVGPLYQGPPPSQVQDDPRGRALVGPVQLLRSGTVDRKDMTTTVPLYRGAAKDGTIVWYILTDTTDEANAEALGLNHSAKLAYANVGRAVRKAWIQEDGSLLFGKGAVDFSPQRSLTPGAAPDFFPPQSFQPGSVGDADYSPLIRIQNAGGHIYNAPVIAYGPEARDIRFCDGDVDYDILHDRVVKICPKGSGSGDSFDADGGTVTLQ
ncbi:MAG: hypothetical protein H0W60_06365, partial [Chloroflexi bacterium]|nr:hypothetical protein [Chloroflexota bacterium]